MDFESDPAADFLNREREELGDLENEIISQNGKSRKKFHFLFSYLISEHISIEIQLKRLFQHQNHYQMTISR